MPSRSPCPLALPARQQSASLFFGFGFDAPILDPRDLNAGIKCLWFFLGQRHGWHPNQFAA
jgi:hypothetical protein